MSEDQPKKNVAIPADLYEFFEKRAARNGRSIETIIEAIVAARQMQCLGGSDEEIVQEYNQRMKFTDEEHEAISLRIVEEIRERAYQEELRERREKGELDDFDD